MDLQQKTIIEEMEDKYRDRNIPFAVIFELTYACNLSCKHCYVAVEHRKELSAEKIKDVLNQLVEMGTFYICFTGGELFARSDCIEILHYAKNKGFFIVILTNGTLITPQIADALKEIKPRGMEISLLGATVKTHDSITGVPGSFEKAVNAIKLLVDRGIHVITKTTLLKFNVHEYQQIKALAKSLGVVPKISSGVVRRVDGEAYPQEYQITWNDRELFLHGELLEESFLTYFFEGSDAKYLTCKAGKLFAAINPYGDVNPCILLPVPLGNLNKKSFREIWYDQENEFLNDLRSLKTGDLTQCSSCTMSSACIRCTGAAYLETNDLKAPFSAACEEARWRTYQLTKKITNTV
jgi:radical SAM protein with 4Fe4S-binding SPASM domain